MHGLGPPPPVPPFHLCVTNTHLHHSRPTLSVALNPDTSQPSPTTPTPLHPVQPRQRTPPPPTKILEVDRELIGPCLDELVADGGVVRELVPGEGGDLLPAVYLVAFHRAEQSLAAGLLALLNSRQERLPAFAAVDWGKALRWLRARTGQDLAPGQQEAAQLALTRKVAVLTGGLGCGKSFTVRSIVELATAKKATVVLAAPTAGPPNGWPS